MRESGLMVEGIKRVRSNASMPGGLIA